MSVYESKTILRRLCSLRLGLFIFLITVLFLCTGIIAQETVGINKKLGDFSVIEKQQGSEATDIIRVLRENGARLGCRFTLEYQGCDISGKISLVDIPIRTNLNADSIPLLISKLRGYLTGFTVTLDTKDPKIVHIIDNVLANDPGYVLNKKISLKYSGNIEPTNLPDTKRPGYAIAAGGLIPAVAEKAGRIIGGTLHNGSVLLVTDGRDAKVTINAVNEPVRDILTDCLPDDYSPVMWYACESIMTGIDDKQWARVQFFSQVK